jgi:hypothetical protein
MVCTTREPLVESEITLHIGAAPRFWSADLKFAVGDFK